MRRLFTIGCSLTGYCYPTWADILGVNFDEYYNFGIGGASNSYIYSTLLEADAHIGLNAETDLVIAMISGFGRFSYLKKNASGYPSWSCHGDMVNYCLANPDSELTPFYNLLWSDEYAIFQSWVAVKSIKNLLVGKNIPHRILLGIDNRSYLSINNTKFSSKVEEIYTLVENKESFMEWMTLSIENADTPKFINEKGPDGHPSTAAHYKFIKEHLPELVTEKSKAFRDYWVENFDYSDRQAQADKYYVEFAHQKNLAWRIPGRT